MINDELEVKQEKKSKIKKSKNNLTGFLVIGIVLIF